MNHSLEKQVNIKAEESGEALRQRFVLLAHCAAEASNDANDETVIAATMMADLLTIAAMFREDSASGGPADEIVEFCQQRGLPLLTDSGSQANRKCPLQAAHGCPLRCGA